VLPALIRRFHEAVEAKAPSVTCWGTGTPLREFLHVDDLGEATGYRGEILWDTSKPDGSPKKQLDVSRLAASPLHVPRPRHELCCDLHQARPTFRAVCTELENRRWKDLAGLCLEASPPEQRTGPPLACETSTLQLPHELQPLLRPRLMSFTSERVQEVDADHSVIFRIGCLRIDSEHYEIGRRSTGEVVVRIDPRYFRPAEVETLLGDPSKAHEKLGWTPTTTLEQLVAEMVAADREEARKEAILRLKGFNVVGSMENPPTNPSTVAAVGRLTCEPLLSCLIHCLLA